MMVLPMALPVLAHHATMSDAPSDAMPMTGHDHHQNAPRDTQNDAPRDIPCPPLETGLEACCVVDGLAPAPPATTTVPRVDRAIAVEISPQTAVDVLLRPNDTGLRDTPHPWPVPSRIVFSTFLN